VKLRIWDRGISGQPAKVCGILVLTLVRKVLFVLARKAWPAGYLDVMKSVNDQTGSLDARCLRIEDRLTILRYPDPARYREVIARG